MHPGGPYYVNKDEGVWTIPKGELGPGEDFLQAALREFHEETGIVAEGEPIALGHIQQASGKTVYAWALEGDADPDLLTSNTFSLEWPPRSGVTQDFPEVDRAAWLSVEQARAKIMPAQEPLLDRLVEQL